MPFLLFQASNDSDKKILRLHPELLPRPRILKIPLKFGGIDPVVKYLDLLGRNPVAADHALLDRLGNRQDSIVQGRQHPINQMILDSPAGVDVVVMGDERGDPGQTGGQAAVFVAVIKMGVDHLHFFSFNQPVKVPDDPRIKAMVFHPVQGHHRKSPAFDPFPHGAFLRKDADQRIEPGFVQALHFGDQYLLGPAHRQGGEDIKHLHPFIRGLFFVVHAGGSPSDKGRSDNI